MSSGGELAQLLVTYDRTKVRDGVELTHAQAAHAPAVKIQADDSKLHTLIMVDPDAPSHKDPRMAEWLHWLITNIPGGDLSSGQEVMPYAGPSPPPGSGKHRYIFKLYEQPATIRVPAPSARGKYSSQNLEAKHHLRQLASTYFTCQTHK